MLELLWRRERETYCGKLELRLLFFNGWSFKPLPCVYFWDLKKGEQSSRGRKNSLGKWFGVFATSLQLTHLLCPPVVVPAVLKLSVRSPENTSISYPCDCRCHFHVTGKYVGICIDWILLWESCHTDIPHATWGHWHPGVATWEWPV